MGERRGDTTTRIRARELRHRRDLLGWRSCYDLDPASTKEKGNRRALPLSDADQAGATAYGWERINAEINAIRIGSPACSPTDQISTNLSTSILRELKRGTSTVYLTKHTCRITEALSRSIGIRFYEGHSAVEIEDGRHRMIPALRMTRSLIFLLLE